ncbi:MAG TPA: 2Fe-2S iron-sulfur cluster-binding protein [Noviherbaspirillum sp.]|nr:2Fe-2S iron-sulfur cluster-binding protein [Noviherbaspirillum sp.]
MSPPDSAPAAPDFRVTVQPHGWTFDTSDATSLMAAAQLAKIALPASCRNGTCRTCMCKLTQGTIRHGIPWPGLSAEEKAEGFILPCVAYACSDLTIEVPLARIFHQTGP